MPELRELYAIREFQLASTETAPEHTGARTVTAIHVLPGGQTRPAHPEELAGMLVVADPGGQPETLDLLLRDLDRWRATALVLPVARHTTRAVPTRLGAAAKRLGLPVLTTTASAEDWTRHAPHLDEYLSRERKRRADDLTGLVRRLPVDPSDPRAQQDIVEWLAKVLRGPVMVIGPEELIAFAPDTAPSTLAPVLAEHARKAPGSRRPGLHTRIVSLPADAMLITAVHQPFDAHDRDMVSYATQALSLIGHSRQQHQASTAAARGARLGAFQLLMVGEGVAAERVLAGLAPGLLDHSHARVYVIDCGDDDRDREKTVQAAEDKPALAKRALVVRCPAFPGQLIIVLPCDEDDTNDSAYQELRDIVDARRSHRLGGSHLHPIHCLGDAYSEAASAVAVARYARDRVALADERPHLLDVLDRDAARRWAGTLLRPVVAQPTSEQLMSTLALGLEFRTEPASRILGCHRNTVEYRLRTAFDLLCMDRTAVLDRVKASLAVQIVTKYGFDDHPSPADPDADFRAMLDTDAVRSWAEAVLKPLRACRGDLVGVLRTWVDTDCNVKRTAAQLSISAKTVRARLQEAEPQLQRELYVHGGLADVDHDDHVLSGVRPLTLAFQVRPSDEPPCCP